MNIALPKGRLGEIVYQILEEAGYPCPVIREENRKLVFENQAVGVRYFWVKPSDVAIYVERAAADVGIAGKDILRAAGPGCGKVQDVRSRKAGFQGPPGPDPAGGHQVPQDRQQLLQRSEPGYRHHQAERLH